MNPTSEAIFQSLDRLAKDLFAPDATLELPEDLEGLVPTLPEIEILSSRGQRFHLKSEESMQLAIRNAPGYTAGA